MKVIIYGAGEIGYSIASYLAAEENDVSVIDESLDRISYVRETLDVQGLQGRGSFPDVLEKANAANADLLIAVTQTDEFNIMACQMAYSVFKVPTKVAHIRSNHYLDPAWNHIYNPDHIPVDFIISPEREVAQSLLDNFHVPGAMSVVPNHHPSLSVVNLYCHENCPLLNQPFVELGRRFPELPFRVICILREGMPIIPGPQDTLYTHDEIYVVVEKSLLSRLLSLFGRENEPLENIVIIGAGRVGCALAEKVAQVYPNINVKLIEKDQEQARFAAKTLENAVIIQGDALDAQFLRESNVSSTDRVICVTNNDETNVLSALLSKNLKAKHVTALVNKDTYPKFLPSLGIDSVINPSTITISHILQRIHRGSIQSLSVLQGGFGSIFEHTITESSPLIGEKFRLFNIAHHCILGGIIRNKQFIIPKSQEFIQMGDHVILLVLRDSVSMIESLLKGSTL